MILTILAFFFSLFALVISFRDQRKIDKILAEIEDRENGA